MAKREPWLAPDQDPVRTEVLREMVREAERVIDGQLKAIEELDDKGESTIRLTVLGLILGLTLGSLTVTNFDSPFPLVLVGLHAIGVGVLFNIIALYRVVHAYSSLGGARNAQSTPDITDLPRRHKTPLMDLEIHLEGLIEGYAHAQKTNHQLMETMTSHRRNGLRLLACVTVPAYVVGLGIIATLALL